MINNIDLIIYSMISAATPIILASQGALMTGYCGTFNIGLEGMMLLSAFFSAYIAEITSNLLLGIIGAILISVIVGIGMILFTLKLRANNFMLGLALNLLAVGLTMFLGGWLLGQKGSFIFRNASKLKSINIPIVANIPIINSLINGHNIFDLLAIVFTFLLYIFIFRTSYGYRMRAVGKSSWVAKSVGISCNKYKVIAYVWCSILCALAGASLSLPLGMFASGPIGMVNGRGWLAIAVVIIAQGNPLRVLMGAWIFGFASALTDLLQITTNFSPRLLMAFPFIFAIIITAIYSLFARSSEGEIKVGI
jgi:simple sugar transport system permease protein